MEIDKRLIVLLKRSADEIKKTVIGKDDIIIKILMTACAGGHILLEDIPGVGKTTMAVAFSKALSLKIQQNAVYLRCYACGCYGLLYAQPCHGRV